MTDPHMTPFTRALVSDAVRKMCDPRGSFYVTDLQTLADVVGATIPTATLNQFRLLHCMSWRDMSPETRHGLTAFIAQICGVTVPEQAADETAPSLWRRLIGDA
jgi:hypothetical protein